MDFESQISPGLHSQSGRMQKPVAFINLVNLLNWNCHVDYNAAAYAGQLISRNIAFGDAQQN